MASETTCIDIEEPQSPDLFSDSEMHIDDHFSEDSNPDTCTWCGANMSKIYNEKGPWAWEPSPIQPSDDHTVLFKLPLIQDSLPIPHKSRSQYCWDKDHVRMPYSNQSLYPVKEDDNSSSVLKPRWELVQEALLKPIKTSEELEQAIFMYNSKYSYRWKFSALHYFFNEVLEEEESNQFFENILPKIVRLALQLPDHLPSSLPLLKKFNTHTISLSQIQISSLLANAFLCTFPRRNTAKDKSEYCTYPDINFNRLYQAHLGSNDENNVVIEKLKCVCHYFRRVTDKAPDGIVTFKRQHVKKTELPRWDKCDLPLSSVNFHIDSKGTIDEDGLGLLQVDFANKFIGGGILGWGSVQEEIRFAICPELIVSRLFTEELTSTEALIVTGVEQYSSSTGYADGFKWSGNHIDSTPRDSFRRRKCYLVAIDALCFSRPTEQYKASNILRELNKAYVGFYSPQKDGYLPAVATGNWGCGAFRGDVYLKALLQFMACRLARRDLVYYTFNDEQLRNDLYKMYKFLSENNVLVSQIWKHLNNFNETNISAPQLYPYIYESLTNSSSKLCNVFTGLFTKKYKTATGQALRSPKETDKKFTKKTSESSHSDNQMSVDSQEITPSQIDNILNTDLDYFAYIDEDSDTKEGKFNSENSVDEMENTNLRMEEQKLKTENKSLFLKDLEENDMKIISKAKKPSTFLNTLEEYETKVSPKTDIKQVVNMKGLDVIENEIKNIKKVEMESECSSSTNSNTDENNSQPTSPSLLKPTISNVKSTKTPAKRKISDYFGTSNKT